MQIGVFCYCDRTGAVSEAGSAYDVMMLYCIYNCNIRVRRNSSYYSAHTTIYTVTVHFLSGFVVCLNLLSLNVLCSVSTTN